MENNEINPGDIVCLASELGSPTRKLFTVGSIKGVIAEVFWYDRITNDLKSMTVPVDALKKSTR